MRYFYQVNTFGEPMLGSNVSIKNAPRTFGRTRWVEFVPVGLSQPCCSTGPLVITSLGKAYRFYVKLQEGTNLPVAGSLFKSKFKPAGHFQEVIAKNQCATTPQWNVTFSWEAVDPYTNDLGPLIGLDMTRFTFVELIDEPTTNGLMTVSLAEDGELTITQIDLAVDSTDTITMQYTNGTCSFAFQMTLVYTA